MDRRIILIVAVITVLAVGTITNGYLYIQESSRLDETNVRIASLEDAISRSNESISDLDGNIQGLIDIISDLQEGHSNVTASILALEEDIKGLSIPDYKVTKVASELEPSVVLISAEGVSGGGSGIILTSDGYVLTANHGLAGISTVEVTVMGGATYPGTVVSRDAGRDLLILKINAPRTDFVPAKLGTSAGLVVGQQVMNIGYPMSSSIEGGVSVSLGIISAFRTVNDLWWIEGFDTLPWIQTDATSNNGNSGGALVNLDGEVIGIMEWSQSDAEGLNFALPIDEAKPFIEESIGQ